jgi:nucleoside-diphosphate-sugar epimerase
MTDILPARDLVSSSRGPAVAESGVRLPPSIAVTGAGGFIGGRLVELLAVHRDVTDLKALSRRSNGKRGVLKVRLDSEPELERALAGCGAIIHCAFDMYDMQSNLWIARAIARVCARNHIRMVQISSAAVYEPMPDGDIDEGQPLRKTDEYRATKAGIEEELQRMSRLIGLDVVILQPTIVYGPGGRAWTDSPVRDLLMGSLVLPSNGNGLCNAVYVDDVCQAAVKALSARLSPGERFLISGATPVKWRDFFGAYDAMIGKRGLRLQPDSDFPRSVCENRPAPSGGYKLALTLKAALFSRMGAKGRSRFNMIFRRIKALLRPNGTSHPTSAQIALYSSFSNIRIDKAKRLLGYAPVFDLPKGMASTRDYVCRTYGKDKPPRLRAFEKIF